MTELEGLCAEVWPRRPDPRRACFVWMRNRLTVAHLCPFEGETLTAMYCNSYDDRCPYPVLLIKRWKDLEDVVALLGFHH
jgi:hypothetical protein